MKKIPLTQGMFAIVDDEDYDYLMRWKWHVTSTGYAARSQSKSEGKSRQVYMHREIANIPPDLITDHESTNKLDNRKANLRACTRCQNNQNNGIVKRNSSGYKGVSWDKKLKKWSSAIDAYGKRYRLGLFFCIVKAAKAYDEAAKKYHGEFANLNFKEKKVDDDGLCEKCYNEIATAQRGQGQE